MHACIRIRAPVRKPSHQTMRNPQQPEPPLALGRRRRGAGTRTRRHSIYHRLQCKRTPVRSLGVDYITRCQSQRERAVAVGRRRASCCVFLQATTCLQPGPASPRFDSPRFSNARIWAGAEECAGSNRLSSCVCVCLVWCFLYGVFVNNMHILLVSYLDDSSEESPDLLVVVREIWIHTIKRSPLWIHTITISLTCGST
jgi:hypothetical protein